MKQQTISDVEYSNRWKKNGQEKFLGSMDEIISWDLWVGIIQ